MSSPLFRRRPSARACRGVERWKSSSLFPIYFFLWLGFRFVGLYGYVWLNDKGTLRSNEKVSNCFSIAPFLGKIIPTEKMRSEIISVGTVLFWGRRFCRERSFLKWPIVQERGNFPAIGSFSFRGA